MTDRATPVETQERLTGGLLLAPALVPLLLVFVYPIGRAVWVSLFAKNLGTKLQPVFVGWDNYVRALGDGRFWQTFGTTTVFTIVSVSLELLLGLAIALVLNRQFRGRDLVRTIAV
jgi:multiple sugar transport system permease protein